MTSLGSNQSCGGRLWDRASWQWREILNFVTEHSNVLAGVLKGIVIPYPPIQIIMGLLLADGGYQRQVHFESLEGRLHRFGRIKRQVGRYFVLRSDLPTWAVVQKLEIIGHSIRVPVLIKPEGHIFGLRLAAVSPDRSENYPLNFASLIVNDCSRIQIIQINKSSLNRSQRLATNSIGFDHLLELAGVDERYLDSDSKNKQLGQEVPVYPPPPSRWAMAVIGVILFGWGRYTLGFRESDITERTAVFALVAMIGGVILALRSI